VATIITIDVMLAKRKMSVTELAERVGITMANLSILKNGKARAIRFSTLEGICRALDCQPGDILEYRPDDTHDASVAARTGAASARRSRRPSRRASARRGPVSA
jgi:putative transcriptional regulator